MPEEDVVVTDIRYAYDLDLSGTTCVGPCIRTQTTTIFVTFHNYSEERMLYRVEIRYTLHTNGTGPGEQVVKYGTIDSNSEVTVEFDIEVIFFGGMQIIWNWWDRWGWGGCGDRLIRIEKPSFRIRTSTRISNISSRTNLHVWSSIVIGEIESPEYITSNYTPVTLWNPTHFDSAILITDYNPPILKRFKIVSIIMNESEDIIYDMAYRDEDNVFYNPGEGDMRLNTNELGLEVI